MNDVRQQNECEVCLEDADLKRAVLQQGYDIAEDEKGKRGARLIGNSGNLEDDSLLYR